MKSYLIVRRYEYEEPHNTQLEFVISNGLFSGSKDIYCGVKQISDLGKALKIFPANIHDEYRFKYGSERTKDRYYRYFILRAYITDSLGHCAIQFHINQNMLEPHEGLCKFSIKADAAAINRLGDLFLKFSELRHLEFYWSPTDEQLYEYHHSKYTF